jgi:hypothetical protein
MRETPALKTPQEAAMYTASARVLGRRQGRLHDNQNNGFGPLFEPPITLTAQTRRGVSIDPRGMRPAARFRIVPAHPAIALGLPLELI